MMRNFSNAILYLSAGIFPLLSVSASANEPSYTIDMADLLLGAQIKVTGNLDTTRTKYPQKPVVQVNECNKENLTLKTNHYGDSIELLLPYVAPPNSKKRCELVVNGALRREKGFKLSYLFKVKDNQYSETADPQWFAFMQFHSKPNKGEQWRCPILALESYNGTLRMFNRWDAQTVSTTVNGTCANEGNSIESRTMFRDISYQSDMWYKFEINGKLSFEEDTDACLTVLLDDAVIANECGPNTFNDWYHPYLKLGIYKPTSWSVQEDVRVEYKNVEYVQY